MARASDDFGFDRTDVSKVARRQLSVSAALIALVGLATLGAAFSMRDGATSALTASTTIERQDLSVAPAKFERAPSSVRPG